MKYTNNAIIANANTSNGTKIPTLFGKSRARVVNDIILAKCPCNSSIVFSKALTSTEGSATSSDFSTAAQVVTFTSASPQTSTIAITDDACYEESETFTVSLGNLEPACSTANGSPTTITITDNDCKLFLAFLIFLVKAF